MDGNLFVLPVLSRVTLWTVISAKIVLDWSIFDKHLESPALTAILWQYLCMKLCKDWWHFIVFPLMLCGHKQQTWLQSLVRKKKVLLLCAVLSGTKNCIQNLTLVDFQWQLLKTRIMSPPWQRESWQLTIRTFWWLDWNAGQQLSKCASALVKSFIWQSWSNT